MKTFFIFPIRCYQKFISPLFPAVCRFTPSCSDYCILAIQKYGVVRGSIKGALRILRCNPWFNGGEDYP
ncbi:MAG: membrane protein insertion efficiency factor YidD [Thermoguttaceae bacterium]